MKLTKIPRVFDHLDRPLPMPRCEAVRMQRYFNDRPGSINTCAKYATYILTEEDGQEKNICHTHAANLALRHVLKEGGDGKAKTEAR